MPASTTQNLPKRKLREFLGKPITITKIIQGNSDFGPYTLLITATDSIISSGKVVQKQAAELQSNLPATVTPKEVEGKNHKYIVLE